MFFLIAFFIIAISCSAITIKTLIGYSDVNIFVKLSVFFMVIIGWFAPMISKIIQHYSILEGKLAGIAITSLYYIFGFCFILICFLFLRDILWYIFYGFAKLIGRASWSINPKNAHLLDIANIYTVIISVVLSLIAIYYGAKTPIVREIEYYSPKVRQERTFVQISDIHINRYTSDRAVQNIVDIVNSQNPDAILLTGDIIDDKTSAINSQLDILKNFKSKQGTFASIGNHELYSGINSWFVVFDKIGFKVLFNKGISLNGGDIYIAGIPDTNTAMVSPKLNVDFRKALQNSSDNQYKILLSHNPEYVEYINGSMFDLQLSGHTHGGQIFPFHLLAKHANKYLSGKYSVRGVGLYVSNGAGTWGPKMRLFAPSEIVVIKIKPEKNI